MNLGFLKSAVIILKFLSLGYWTEGLLCKELMLESANVAPRCIMFCDGNVTLDPKMSC